MTLSLDRAAIEQIVREVIHNLTKKPCLLLVHGENCSDEEINNATADLQAQWHVLAMSLCSPDIVVTNNAIKHVVIMDVDQDILIRGALGFTDTPTSALLANALHNGMPVTLVPCKSAEWILQSNTSEVGLPEPAVRYRKHIIKHKDILASFGTYFLRQSELQTIAIVNGIIESPISKEETLYFSEKVLTQRDIQLMDVNIILISRRTVVTPLARDTARNKGITIHVKES